MKGFIFSVNEKFLSGRREDWMVVFVERGGEKIRMYFSHLHIFGNSLLRKNYLFYIFVHTYGCDQELNYQIGLYTLLLYINVVFPARISLSILR